MKNEEKQNIFDQTLSDLKIILDKNNQSFFLAYGTALGAYRDKKFIGHDPDIDIGIIFTDLNVNLSDIFKNTIFKIKHKLGHINNSYEISVKHKKTKINVDIFIFYHIIDDYYYAASHLHPKCYLTNEEYCKWGQHIKDFKKIKLGSNYYDIPSNTEEFLKDKYGEHFMTPMKYSYVNSFNYIPSPINIPDNKFKIIMVKLILPLIIFIIIILIIILIIKSVKMNKDK